jgi:hypothetical protein
MYAIAEKLKDHYDIKYRVCSFYSGITIISNLITGLNEERRINERHILM